MVDSKGVVIVGELADGNLASITTELLGVGRKLADDLGQELSALFIGSGIGEAANEAIFFGADKVYVVDKPLFRDYLTDSYVGAVEKFVKQVEPDILLLGHTALGIDAAPMLAFRLEVELTQDCVELAIDPETKLLQKTKPIYGGNALAVYVGEEGRLQMATIRAKAMESLTRDASRDGEIVPFDPELDEAAIRGKVIDKVKDEITGVKLEDADVVVCGGRGLGGADAFQQFEEFARILNAAVGATRPPCDAKWCPDYYQIGLTGKIISPSLYIGIALSGSSQHLAGMSGSKTIVAVNKDPEANIFNIAHYGVVGDFKKALPAFMEKCREILSEA